MKEANEDIRQLIFESKIPKYMIAREYGCTDSTFSKKLRFELSQEEKLEYITFTSSHTIYYSEVI